MRADAVDWCSGYNGHGTSNGVQVWSSKVGKGTTEDCGTRYPRESGQCDGTLEHGVVLDGQGAVVDVVGRQAQGSHLVVVLDDQTIGAVE